jgi:hypothetical protein
MPGHDRTGPLGQGSRTGRGLGKCRPKVEKSDSDETNREQSLNDLNYIARPGNQGHGGNKGFGNGQGGAGRGKGLGQGLGRNR